MISLEVVGLNTFMLALIGGTTFIFLSKDLPPNRKETVLTCIMGLFIAYLCLVYAFETDGTIFSKQKFSPKIPESILKSSNFRLEVSDSTNKTISLVEELQRQPKVAIYFEDRLKDLRSMLHLAMQGLGEQVVYFSFKNNIKDFEGRAIQIMQHVKNHILSYKTSAKKALVFSKLNTDLYEHDFVELLLLIQANNPNLRFIILEEASDNIQLVKRKALDLYAHVTIREVIELDPVVFKTILIEHIMRSRSNSLTEVQAAKVAHDLYQSTGSNFNSLEKAISRYT